MNKLNVVFGNRNGYNRQSAYLTELALNDAEHEFNRVKERTPNLVILSVQYMYDSTSDELSVTCIITYIKM